MLMTILLISLSCISGFAAQINFTDINEAPWAKEYINKMAEKKIISGYFDKQTKKSTFKPNQPVSYIESVQMIYGTLKAASRLEATANIVNKHANLLKTNNIPEWSHEAIAYAIEYNIVQEDELKGFMKNGKQAAAKREDVAIFIGKSLNMDELIDPLPILDFVDAELVKPLAVPYVDLLAKKGIVTGDPQKKFHPKKSVTRAEMAVMCSKTYDLLSKSSTPKPADPEEPKETTVKGTLQYADITAKLIVIENDAGEKSSYEIIDTPIKKNGESKTISELTEGDKLELFFSDNKLKRIEIIESIDQEEEYPYVVDFVDEKSKMFLIKDADGKTLVYNVEDVAIRIDGANKNIKDLRAGYRVKLIFDSEGDLIRIDANTTANSEFEGMISKLRKIDSNYYLITVTENKNIYDSREFIVDDDTEIKYRRSNENLLLNKLQEGQQVRVEFVGDRAFKVTIDEEEVEYAGILEDRIEFKKEYPVLKIRTNNDRVLELEVDEYARVRRDSRREDLDALAKGDIVIITVKNNKVTDIISTSRNKKSTVEGTIRQIIIGNPSKITMYDDDIDEESTYEISDSVDVYIDGKSADLKDLELRYRVELRIEGGVVIEIDAEKSAGNETVTGKIDRIYSKYNRLIVKNYDDYLKKHVKTTIEITDDTKIISNSGKDIRLGNLSEDTEVFVSGYLDDDMFIADKIIELE